VDVNVGDPIWPAPAVIALPRLLGGETALLGYPLEMVYAEKIVTAIQRGVTNTRWRDFADIILLSRGQAVAGATLQEALRIVGDHRGAALVPLDERLAGYPAVAQTKWSAWRRRQQLMSRVPESFATVLASVVRFADPALHHEVGERSWDPGTESWVGLGRSG
jgi:Nucleotidyl transferase AbiEii toxin, Type IV TA system